MRFPCRVLHETSGQWTLEHDGPEVGRIAVTAPTREQAVEKMRAEIRYRLELCPCSGESYQHIRIDVSEL